MPRGANVEQNESKNPKMTRERTSRVGLRLTDDLRSALESECSQRGTSLTATVVALLRAHLRENGHTLGETPKEKKARVAIETYASVTHATGKEVRRRDAKALHEHDYALKRPAEMRLAITVDAAERLAIRAIAADLGCKDVEVCTSVIRRWLGSKPEPVGDDQRSLKRIEALARKAGNNINQAQHALNAIALAQSQNRRQVLDVDAIHDMRSALHTAARETASAVEMLAGHFVAERARWHVPDDTLMAFARQSPLD